MPSFIKKAQVNFSDLLFQYEFHAESGVFPGFTESCFIKVHDQYLYSDYRKDALRAIEAGLKYFPKSSTLYAYKAIRLMESRKTNQALENLTEAEFQGHCLVEAAIIRAQIFVKQNKQSQALGVLRSLKEDENLTNDQRVQVVLAEADILEEEGMAAEAFDNISGLLFKQPNNPEALVAVKALVENQRWYKDSIDLHLELTARDSFAWAAWYNLGHAYYGAMEFDKAIEAFEYSYLINKKFAPAYLDRAEVCQHMLMFNKALMCFRDVLEFTEATEPILHQIGDCYFGLDRYDEAKKFYIRAVQLNKHNDELFFKIGKCYEKEYALKTAERFYKKAWQLDELREDYVEALATCYFKMGRHSKVTPLLEKVITMNPTEDHAWVMYAKYLILTGQFEIAKSLFVRAEDHTYSGKLVFCHAALLYILGEEQKAFELFGEALEEAYECVGLFFELVPHVRHDKKVQGALNYYDPEYYIG